MKQSYIVLLKLSLNPGILRDKTVDDELMYIPNDDNQNFTLKLLVEKFEH